MSSPYIPDWLARRAQFSPEKVAIVDTITQRHFTYAQWNAQANRTAHFIQHLGVHSGDRIAILASNSMAYLDIWFACNKLGSILQALNWRLTAYELSSIICEAEPKILFYSKAFKTTVERLYKELPYIKQWIALEEKARPQDILFHTRENYPITPLESPHCRPDDTWVICYTGGTTGLPKGAMLSYRAIQTNAINTLISWNITENDVAILNAPLFHTGGLNVFTSPLVYAGGTSLLCQQFNVEQTFDLIESGGATLFFGVPTMFILMQQHPRWEKADFSRLKMVISGGAPCPLPVFEKFWQKGIDFKTGYGLTEAGPNTFFLPAADVRRKPGAVGFPLFHIEIQLRNGEGQICQTDEIGELLIRGEHVFSGYWRNPEASHKAMPDGWLHTGDLAICDEEGYYTIVGRSKEMIISGGENIYPAEIESVLYGHPKIAEAAVIGVPDDKWGEVVCAFIVLRDHLLNESALRDYCSERLATYKMPKIFRFVDELPKTGAGKLDKSLLKKQY
jgi:fatty-acyl-CoA synthase